MEKKKKLQIILVYNLIITVLIILLPKLIAGNNDILKSLMSSSFVFIFQVILFVINLLFSIKLYVELGKVDNLETISLKGLLSKEKVTSDTNKYVDQGSAKIGTVEDLKDLSGQDGFVISKNFKLSSSYSYEHVLVLGPTGAGKSSSFFIPNLLELDGSTSVVVTDPKGEMYEKTSNYLKEQGYNVIKLSPLKLEENDMYYNPLLVASSNTEVRQVSQSILLNGGKSIEISTGSPSNNTEWINMATPLLTATLLYVKEYGKKKTVTEALDIILTNDLEELERKFSMDENAHRSFLIFKSSAGSEKTLASIKTVLTTNMQLFIDEQIEEFTKTEFTVGLNGPIPNKRKMFDPLILRNTPTVLFICVEEIQSTYLMPLMSILYTQILKKTMENTGYPIYFLLDEFANIGVIDNIEGIISTARSREIGIALGIQDIEQLSRNYGETTAQIMLNNLKTRLIFSGLTGSSAEYVSELSDYTTVEAKNVSNDPTGGLNAGNVSKTGVRRELFTKGEVRRMNKDEVLIIAHDKDAVKDLKNVYYTQEKYLAKIEEL